MSGETRPVIRISYSRTVKSFEARYHIPLELRKYFNTNRVKYEYDEDITNVDESMLSIPALSCILPFSYALGADIVLPAADRDFLKNENAIKNAYKKWFPEFNYRGRLNVGKISNNTAQKNCPALLFSAGVDSLYSAMSAKRKPILYTLWGADIPLSETNHWKSVKSSNEKFCAEFGFRLHTIKTNMRDLINEKLIVKELKLRDWWGEVSHGLLLISSLAPSIIENGSKIIIASTHAPGHAKRWGSMPDLDSSIRFCNIGVEHERELSRQEKIRYLYTHYPDSLKYLRVCYSNFGDLNCGKCEKCLRTMIELIIEGADINKCNFNFHESIYEILKRNFYRKSWFFFGPYYEEMKKSISNKTKNSPQFDKDFFEWFKNTDFQSHVFNPKSRRHEEIISYLKSSNPSRLLARAAKETRYLLWRNFSRGTS